MRDCAHCGTSIPLQSRFCPECGRAIAGAAGIAPRAERRLWPPDPLLVVVLALAGGAVILLVGGVWAWGLVVLFGAGLVFLLGREAERRAAKYALAGFHARFSAAREAMAVRSRGQLELFRARRERAELEADRLRALQKLGHAVFYDDAEGTDAAKADVAAVVERIGEKEAEIETLIRQTEERVQRAQAGFQPTEKLEAPPEPAPKPEDAPVPQKEGRRKT